MLVLRRAKGERIRVDGPCEIVVTWIGSNRVRLGFDAGREVVIMRSEIADRERTEPDGTDEGSPR